jgi:hypothetical protein
MPAKQLQPIARRATSRRDDTDTCFSVNPGRLESWLPGVTVNGGASRGQAACARGTLRCGTILRRAGEGRSAVNCAIVEGTSASELTGNLDRDCDVDPADLAAPLARYGEVCE